MSRYHLINTIEGYSFVLPQKRSSRLILLPITSVMERCGRFSDMIQDSPNGSNMLEDQTAAGMETTLESSTGYVLIRRGMPLFSVM